MGERMETIRPKRWTQEEIRRFRQLYPTSHNKDLAKTFHRTIYSIRRKAIKLGIGKDWAGGYRPPQAPQNQNLWTANELAELQKMYRDSTIPEIAQKLGRSPLSVQTKIKRLRLFRKLKEQGLPRHSQGQWSDEQIAILTKFYRVETNVQTGRRLGKSPNAVGRMVQKLRLSKLFQKTGRSRKVAWTDAEDVFLKEHIFIWPVKKIAKEFNRSISSVKARAWKKRWLKQNLWTKQESSQLRYLLSRYSYKEISAKLGRSIESVKRKRKRMGLEGKGWTDIDIKILRKFFPIETNAEVAKRLGMSSPTIAPKARKLGLRKSIYAKFATVRLPRRAERDGQAIR